MSANTILVADAEALPRLLARRVLEKHFGMSATECASGPEVLLKLEESPPDLIILSDDLDVIDGFSVLQAIRSDDRFAGLPVVFLSQNADRRYAESVIRIGVSDFILKPLDINVLQNRLGHVLIVARARKERFQQFGLSKSWSMAKKTLLIVTGDVNFRTFAQAQLESAFNILVATTAPEALRLASDAQPEVVLVADGVGLFNSDLLARTLRSLPGAASTRVLIASDRPPPTATSTTQIVDRVAKSFVPSTFLSSFNRALYGVEDPTQEFGGIRWDALRPSLLSALQQVFGVMLGSEVKELDVDPKLLAHDLWASVLLIDSSDATTIIVDVVTSMADARTIAGSILGAPVDSDEVATETLAELARSLAGRVRAEFDARGVHVESGDVRVSVASPANVKDWSVAATGELSNGEKILLGLRKD